MNRSVPRLILAVATAGTAVGIQAETYTALIYSTPGSYPKMFVAGAGDNALMSGYVQEAAGEPKAAYRTSTGWRFMYGGFSSQITDSWGSTYHCGFGRITSSSEEKALFWIGGDPAITIHPSGAEYVGSRALGGFGQIQVGQVTGTINCDQCGISVAKHAGVWSRTSSSFKRLHSTTHRETFASATDGVSHVGAGIHRTDGSLNALLWNNTQSTAINIRPSMSISSEALSVSGAFQGGYVVPPLTNGKPHACLWTGSAASAVDLNPNGVFSQTTVKAVRGNLQVGNGVPIFTPTRFQAVGWHGTAGSWINLHSRLPAAFQTWHSFAEGIDNQGNVTGYVSNPAGTDVRPVVWMRS